MKDQAIKEKPKKSYHLRRNTKKNLFVFGMLIIPIIHFFVFWLYVNVDSILLAFRDVTGSWNDFGHFKWYFSNLVSDRPYVNMAEALRNTLIFWSWNVFLELPLALVISYFIFKKIRGGYFFKVMLYLPAIVSAVIMTTAFKNVIAVGGPLDQMIKNLFNHEIPMLLYDSRYAMPTLLGYNLWTGFGVNIILFTGAMTRIPEETFESAKIDGITPFKELTQIILPLIWPVFSTVIILSVAGIFSASGPILLFTQGEYGTMTISYSIFQQYFEYNQINRAAAIGLIFTVMGIPIIIFSRWLLSKWGEDIEY